MELLALKIIISGAILLISFITALAYAKNLGGSHKIINENNEESIRTGKKQQGKN